MDIKELALTPKREQHGSGNASHSFRAFGDAGYAPKDAFDVTPLVKTIGICARGGILIINPTK
ncbi:hypothetical protein FB446DRAFT_790690 [Lentinula raphanica]|nr:hypothetical protein FB446DRAFT_790690 [Lentinula raphanica]